MLQLRDHKHKSDMAKHTESVTSCPSSRVRAGQLTVSGFSVEMRLVAPRPSTRNVPCPALVSFVCTDSVTKWYSCKKLRPLAQSPGRGVSAAPAQRLPAKAMESCSSLRRSNSTQLLRRRSRGDMVAATLASFSAPRALDRGQGAASERAGCFACILGGNWVYEIEAKGSGDEPDSHQGKKDLSVDIDISHISIEGMGKLAEPSPRSPGNAGGGMQKSWRRQPSVITWAGQAMSPHCSIEESEHDARKESIPRQVARNHSKSEMS